MKKVFFPVLILLSLLKAFPINAQTNPNLEWVRQIGGIDYEKGTAVAVDGTGNVYTAGRFEGTVDFDPSNDTHTLTSTGTIDVFIAKFDALGNFLWVKQIEGTSTYDWIRSISVDVSGNLYATGVFRGTVDFDPNAAVSNYTSIGGNDIFIIKLNANGELEWAKHIGAGYEDFSNAIELDASGNIYVTGSFGGTVDFDPGTGVSNIDSIDGSVFFMKMDSMGNLIWVKQIEGYNSNSIVLDSSGNIYMTGNFSGTADFDPDAGVFDLISVGEDDIFIGKYNASGNFIWAKSIGSTEMFEQGVSIAVDGLGNVYTLGEFANTVDFDPGSGSFFLTSSGGTDLFVSKLDVSGNFMWASRLGGIYSEYGISLVVDANNNVYVAGNFIGTIDFTPGSFTLNSTAGGGNILIGRLNDMSGNFEHAFNIGGSGICSVNSFVVDNSNNLYLTGHFSSTTDFDPGSANTSLVANGGEDAFILKLKDNLSITHNQLSQNIAIYPNPVSYNLNISSKSIEINQVSVYDFLGRKVMNQNLGGLSTVLNMESLSAGMYVVEVVSGEGTTSHKIIKE